MLPQNISDIFDNLNNLFANDTFQPYNDIACENDRLNFFDDDVENFCESVQIGKNTLQTLLYYFKFEDPNLKSN